MPQVSEEQEAAASGPEVGMGYRKVAIVTPTLPIRTVNIWMQFVRSMAGRGIFNPTARSFKSISDASGAEESITRRGARKEKKSSGKGLDVSPVNAEAW